MLLAILDIPRGKFFAINRSIANSYKLILAFSWSIFICNLHKYFTI